MDQLDTDFLESRMVFISEELGIALYTGQRLKDIESASDGRAGIIFQGNGEIAQCREAVEVFEDDCS